MNKIRTESLISAKKAVNNIRKHGLAAIPLRYIVVILSAFTNALSYTMRTNLNLTIVAMVKRANDSHTLNTCMKTVINQTSGHIQEEIEGEFEWTESMQGIVLGAYYYGYIITNVMAGQLADLLGARWLVGASVLSSGFLTLVVPICAQWSVYSVIAVRVLTGLVQGVMTPSLYTMLAYWVPVQERSMSLAVVAVGGNIGAVLTMPLSSYLSQHGFSGGWPSVFYVLGVLGCFCFIPWIYQIYNSPAEHPRISGKELLYIQANVTVSNNRKRKAYVPWGSIVTSTQVWIALVTKFCVAWGNLFLMSKLPTYLESVLHLSMDLNAAVNAAIYIAFSASLMGFGYFSDVIETKRLLSRTVSRKVFETIALLGSALLMAVVPAVGCDQTAVIVILICGMIVLGLTAGGDNPIVVDIAPDYSGSLYGFQNAFASIPGFLAPLVVGLVLDGDSSKDPLKQWNILFYIAAGIYVFGALVFVFISAKPEAWGRARHGTIRTTIDEHQINVIMPSRSATFCETDINDCEIN